tara:strand:- start:240 stop:500 length:261 start_codon:yes stop_codon:yes gene_type:complete
MDYTITVTDTEKKALDYIAINPQEFIENFAKHRANNAIKEIITKNTEHCNANSIQLAVGQDAQVQQAYDLGVVKTVAQLNSELTND